jgi:hypothetical protein
VAWTEEGKGVGGTWICPAAAEASAGDSSALDVWHSRAWVQEEGGGRSGAVGGAAEGVASTAAGRCTTAGESVRATTVALVAVAAAASSAVVAAGPGVFVAAGAGALVAAAASWVDAAAAAGRREQLESREAGAAAASTWASGQGGRQVRGQGQFPSS